MTVSMVSWEEAQHAPAGVIIYNAGMILAPPAE
jgi:hypothetical protein